ncbi:MAG: J domain-containing protein [Verrucomicrobia bacterium]|nr:J domain-containing protein [Verrucomicrobiota bacterium]
MERNYYLVLGVGSDASQREIKAAFRQRAQQLHPDKSGLNSGPFIEAQEAYATLSDPGRRRAYDRRLREPEIVPATSFRDISLFGFEQFHPSFDELFDRLWSNFAGISRPKAETLESLTLEVILSPQEARAGGRVRVEIPARAPCATCRGRGHVAGYECWRCAGDGALTAEQPVDIEYPAGIRGGHVARLPLSQFGIYNFYLTLHFRVSGEEA